MTETQVGFAPEEIRTNEPTRSARLKWAIVVSTDLAAGQVANAVACVAAATATRVSGLLAHGVDDADGVAHPGLPWAGCAILQANPEKLRSIHGKATRREDVLAVDMPLAAQETRVYDEFLERVAALPTEEIAYAAVSLVGERKPVDRIIGGLSLLG